jgi:hypothetical protein
MNQLIKQKENVMKNRFYIVTSVIVCILAIPGFTLEPSQNHTTYGIGLAVDNIPVSMASLVIPLSCVSYEHQFANPKNKLRGGVELGAYGFYFVLPIPEVGTNMYIGGEDQAVQGKIGLTGFYDLFVGGHGGLGVKAGIILNNRFDFDILIVPPKMASDSKRSYQEALGLESKDKADAYYAEHGYHVKTPYFALLACVRF